MTESRGRPVSQWPASELLRGPMMAWNKASDGSWSLCYPLCDIIPSSFAGPAAPVLLMYRINTKTSVVATIHGVASAQLDSHRHATRFPFNPFLLSALSVGWYPLYNICFEP